MTGALVVSLSGLTADPAVLDRAAALVDDLGARGVVTSHLFRPRTRGGAPADPAVVAFLRERRAAGDEVALHGFDHHPDPIGAWQSSPVRLGRRAEFAMLPRHEAALRITAARRAARAVGLDTDVFAGPRWLVSPGTVEALRAAGFAVCADETSVRLLRPVDAPRRVGAPGRGVARARVLGFRASGERRPVADDRRAAEAWRARLLVAEAARVARRGGLVRIALRAKDLRKPARVDGALAAVEAVLALGAVPVGHALGTVRAGAA